VIAISLLLALIFHETLSWVGVFANVAYFTNYYECFGGRSDIPGLNILWSLAVEEHFYMVFPLLYLLTCHTSRSRQGTLLVSLCALVLLWRCVLVFYFHSASTNLDRTYTATDTRVDSILWGCLFAIVCNPVLGDRQAQRMANWWVGGIALAVLGFCLVFRPPWFRETFRYTIQGIALMPLFALAILRGMERPLRFLNWYGMRLVGVYSYTIYLTHFVVLHYLMPEATPKLFPIAFLIAFSISFILAAAMHRFVDLPAAMLRKRYSRA
jgi:peptidoglycan/LPS O-acetylase OafA/YrhL